MICRALIHSLHAAALALAGGGDAAVAEDLRLSVALPTGSRAAQAAETAAADLAADTAWSVRAAPDGRRLIVDLPFDLWTAAPRVIDGGEAFGAGPETGLDAGGAATLRAGQGPDGRARLIVATAAAVDLRSASLRRGPGEARLNLVLRPRVGAPSAPAPPPRPEPAEVRDRPPLVVIDPGHGGIDPGAVVGGIREKDLVDAFAADLAAALRASGRWRVTFTRDGDRFMRLDDRWRRADAQGAAILLSIHANTVARGDAEGATVFTRAEAGGSAGARALARLENQATDAPLAAPSALPPERRALRSLARRLTLAESRAAGDGLAYALSLATPMLRDRAHEQARFRVLSSAHTPSALIELGFLTNADDLARLQSPDWRARAAGALTAGLERWRARAAGLSSDPARRYAPPQGKNRVATRRAVGE